MYVNSIKKLLISQFVPKTNIRMVFKCQEDSFLKEFTSKVVSCSSATVNSVNLGRKTKFEGYEVVLEDTIIFPEGGGQPSDTGYLNDSKVYQVVRKSDIAVHYVDKPLAVGEEVKQVVDWERRFDHMQQHSGQHLITAIFDQEYKFATTSWWLGEDISYIELNSPVITQEQIDAVEQTTNSLIREARAVTVTTIKEESKDELLKDVRCRDLPADHKGDIRIINMEGIEGNMCCGTHVKNLSQLQAIKLLYAEKNKKKDKSLLYFVVGNRVLQQLHNALDREKKMSGLLKTNPSNHADMVDKLQKNVKIMSKNLQTTLKDLAIMEASKLKTSTTLPKYYSLHRKEAEADFMNVFIQEFGRTDLLLFLSTGDEKGIGNIVLYGPEPDVQQLGPMICELLNGKGAGKGNKYQAKVNNMSNRTKAEKLMEEHLV